MKRFVLMIILALASVFTSDAKWKTYSKNDVIIYRYEVKGKAFEVSEGSPIMLSTKVSLFDYEDECVMVTVRYFENGEEIKTEKFRFFIKNGDGAKVYSAYGKKKSKKVIAFENRVINHLKNVGDIEIYAPIYMSDDLLLYIPQNKNLNF